jgi:hypothetical protein
VDAPLPTYNCAISMSDDRSTTPNWWQTVPGMLTGVAAIITAVTGPNVALNHTGNRELS